MNLLLGTPAKAGVAANAAAKATEQAHQSDKGMSTTAWQRSVSPGNAAELLVTAPAVTRAPCVERLLQISQ